MKYLVIKHDYLNKVTRVENDKFYSLQNSTEYVQNMCYDFVIENMGKKTKIHDYHRFYPASRYWNGEEYGYHIVRNVQESLYKLTIVEKKKINGYLFDSYIIRSLFYYEIVRYDNEIPSSFKDYYTIFKETSDEQIKNFTMVYDQVLDEILNKFHKKSFDEKSDDNYKGKYNEVVDGLRDGFQNKNSK